MTRDEICKYYDEKWSGKAADFEVIEDFCEEQSYITTKEVIEKACEWFNKWQGNMAACEVHACNIEWWTNQMRKDLEEELI